MAQQTFNKLAWIRSRPVDEIERAPDAADKQRGRAEPTNMLEEALFLFAKMSRILPFLAMPVA